MSMRALHCSLIAVATTMALSVAAAPPSLDDTARSFGIGAEDMALLRAGHVVTKELEPAAPTELGVALAVLVKKPLASTLAFMKSEAFFEQDRQVLAHGAIDPANPKAGLAKVAFTTADSGEIGKLLQAKAGDALNLSSAEAERLRAVAAAIGGDAPWKDPKAPALVSEAYRSILAARFEAYRTKGLAGIEPLDRGGGKTSDPAARLRGSQKAATILHERVPELERALTEGASGDVKERWLWLEQTAQDRPVFLLSHRLHIEAPGAVFAAERQFFVGHSWDCGFIIGGLVETDAGTLLVYANRVHVDAAAGAMGGMKRSIGRGMMEKSIRALFERVKRAAEASGG